MFACCLCFCVSAVAIALICAYCHLREVESDFDESRYMELLQKYTDLRVFCERNFDKLGMEIRGVSASPGESGGGARQA